MHLVSSTIYMLILSQILAQDPPKYLTVAVYEVRSLKECWVNSRAVRFIFLLYCAPSICVSFVSVCHSILTRGVSVRHQASSSQSNVSPSLLQDGFV